jgi:hypothetical protein
VSTPPVAFRVSVHGSPRLSRPHPHRPAVVPHQTVAARRKNPAGPSGRCRLPTEPRDRSPDDRSAVRSPPRRTKTLARNAPPEPARRNPPATNRGSARKPPLEIAGSWEC